MTVGERINMLRELKDMTLEEVARRVGITESTAQRYESGTVKTIPYDRIVALAEIFGCDPAYIMGWQKEAIRYDNNESIREIIATYKLLPQEEKEYLLSYARFLARKKGG